MRLMPNGTVLAVAVAVSAAVLLSAVPAQAVGGPGAGRIATTIGHWRGDGVLVSVTGGTTVFTIPAVGTSGPIDYLWSGGGTFCLLSKQSSPYSVLYWGTPTAADPCQDVTTVRDPGSGQVGFTATDGPYAGRFLGDYNQGGVVDWDLRTFFGVDVPGVKALDPQDDAASTAGPPVRIDILANDGDTTGWTATPGAAPAHGAVTFDADGMATYTPEAGFVGDDSFTYEVADADGATGTATVRVTVTGPIAPPPTEEPDPGTGEPDPGTDEPDRGGAAAPAGPVAGAAAAPKGPARGSTQRALADTGSGDVTPSIGLAALLIALGAGSVVVARRRSASAL